MTEEELKKRQPPNPNHVSKTNPKEHERKSEVRKKMG